MQKRITVTEMFLRVLSVLLVCLLSHGVSHISEAATSYVRDNYKNIQDAINNAAPNDTIIVRDGEYAENIVISKPLTVKSEHGSDKTVVRASKPSEPVILVAGVSKVTVSGFTVSDSSVAGIYLNNAANIELRDNKAVNNRHGIFLDSSGNNILTHNYAAYNKLAGIYLDSSHNNTLEKNEASLNKEKGIFLNSSNNNNIVDNIANRNEWNGITLWVSNNNKVEKNEVMRNTYSIILSGSTGNIVNDNSTWTNLYIILPILLIYIGIVLFFIQRKIFILIYRES